MSMQAVEATPEQSTDIAMTVVVTMRQMGVLGLPRNYEIFYEALTGSNHELSVELVSLGKRPKQEELDRIGHKYFAQKPRSRHRRRRSRDDLAAARGSHQDPAQRAQLPGKIQPHPRPDRRGPEQPAADQQGYPREDRRRDVDGDHLDHRPRQAGGQLARRQVDGAGKRQVEARGVQEARRHRSADAHLEPPRVRPAHRQDLRFAQERDVQRADPRRHRPLQGNQRPLRPSGRRQDHPDHRRDPAVEQPRRHVRGAHRRRGVRADRRRRQRRGDATPSPTACAPSSPRRRSPTARPA